MDLMQRQFKNLLDSAASEANSAATGTCETLSTPHLIQTTASVSIAISLCVLVGWATHLPSLTRWTKATPSMVPETAIGILLAASGLLFAQRSRRQLAGGMNLGWISLCIGSSLLGLGSINLIGHSSQLAMENLSFLATPAFQMAQGSAIGFLMLGVALILLSARKVSLPAIWTVALLGTGVAMIGLVTIFGQFSGLNSAPWWGSFFLKMALPTAISCCALGITLVSIFFQHTSGTSYQFSVTAAIMSILALLLLFAGVDAAVLAGSNSISDARAVVRKASDEMKAIQELIDCVRTAESGQRGFLLTGERQYLADFYVGRQGFERAVREKTVDDARLMQTIALKFDELDRTIALEETGHHEQALTSVKSSYGIRLMEEIDLQQKLLYDQWQRRLLFRREDSERALVAIEKTVLWSYATALLFALGTVLLILAEMRRRSRIESELRETEVRTNAELRRQTVRAEEASRAKSNFLASMSHEIRTPMNAILGMADMLWETDLSETQRHYVEIFRRAGGNLLTLINDILDLSKIESGKFSLENIAFDLVEVVEQLMEIVTPKADAKGIELIANIEPGTATSLIGDPVRLQQVLLNLLGNAIKFTQNGNVSLRIRSQGVGDRSRLEFDVADTGIGIAEDKLLSIFEDFTQAESSITRRFGGTGLGLSICRRLVNRMGGQLQVSSEVGCGSTFTFQVELQVAADQQTARAAEFVEIMGKRVLVVDNSSTNRTILGVMCSVWGMQVTSCASGAEAIEVTARSNAAGQPFDLALVDRIMPEMDGFETAVQVRRQQPAVPIIIVSSDSLPGDIQRCRELCLSGHLLKPVRRSALLQQIVKALHRTEDPLADEPDLPPDSAIDPAPQRHLQVLAAEDSEDNRFLLGAYCAGTKYDLTFAADGSLAVEAFQRGHFDMVLMDVQMPVMDGISATKAIRAMEKNAGLRSVPILAMTANALPMDMAATAQAGCNAHIAKPISKKGFLAALDQWDKPPAGDDPAGRGDRDESSDDEDGVGSVAGSYLGARLKEITRFQELLQSSDFQELRRLSHNLKGSGTSFGFPDITRLGGAMEQASQAGDRASLSNKIGELADYVESAGERLRKVA